MAPNFYLFGKRLLKLGKIIDHAPYDAAWWTDNPRSIFYNAILLSFSCGQRQCSKLNMSKMNNLPPFDPPYTTTYRTEESTRIVRTLPDGTKQDGVTEEKVQPRRKKSKKQQRAAKQSSPSANHAKNGKPAHLNLIPSNGRAFLYLDVPFHEKDQVKNLGGKWDSAMRKWYIPHGVDVHLFTRWWPETLKQETKMFGQL